MLRVCAAAPEGGGLLSKAQQKGWREQKPMSSVFSGRGEWWLWGLRRVLPSAHTGSAEALL